MQVAFFPRLLTLPSPHSPVGIFLSLPLQLSHYKVAPVSEIVLKLPGWFSERFPSVFFCVAVFSLCVLSPHPLPQSPWWYPLMVKPNVPGDQLHAQVPAPRFVGAAAPPSGSLSTSFPGLQPSTGFLRAAGPQSARCLLWLRNLDCDPLLLFWPSPTPLPVSFAASRGSASSLGQTG